MTDYSGSKPTILIVDDEPNNLKVLYGLLNDREYEVRAARNGQMALDNLQMHVPDLVLLDIKMPEMDGYEVCRQIKANPATAEVPVIFISALNQVADIVEAFDVGGVDYITKPFQFEEVLARVDTHLTLVHQKQQLLIQGEQIEAMHQKDRERFQTISKMREQFVQAAAHDLKNPLSLVIGYAEMMQRIPEVRSHPQLSEIAQHIHESGEDMLRLVHDMLEMLQLQSQYKLERHTTDLVKLLAELLPKHQLQAMERDISIIFRPEEQEINLSIDQRLIERAINNLISNAIKYSPDGHKVFVTSQIADDKAIISVRDEGYGISPEAMPHLFDPFYRAEVAGKKIEGTGLGLAIVKEIVEQHRGRVDVSSELDEGSTFSIELPL